MEPQPLPGGNSAPVVRLGDTVRRVAGPWTPNVAALMTGLRAAGVPGVPEHRGLDEQGREVVAWVDGDVPVYPMPEWLWSDEVLTDVGRLVRRVHDASAALDLPREGWRREAVEPVEVVGHGDVAPYNCVFVERRLVALIDWDHAVPCPRLRDLGAAAYRFVSLTPPGHPDGLELPPAEQWRRVGVLARAYGDVSAHDVVRWAALHLEDLIAWSCAQAAAGDAALQATVDAGHVRLYEGDLRHVRSLLAEAVDPVADHGDDGAEDEREHDAPAVDEDQRGDRQPPQGSRQPRGPRTLAQGHHRTLGCALPSLEVLPCRPA